MLEELFLKLQLKNLNVNGRIPVCGQISVYNSLADPRSAFQTSEELGNRLKEKNIKREFYSVNQFLARYDEAFDYILNKIKEGKLINRETVFNGIESWPNAFLGLFTGENTGKAVVKVHN